MRGVSRQFIEALRGIDHGKVGELKIAECEGDGAVDWPEIDDRMRAAPNLEEDRHHVETAGAIETRVDERIVHPGNRRRLFREDMSDGLGLPRVRKGQR